MPPLLRPWKSLCLWGIATGFSLTVLGQTVSPLGGEYDIAGALPGVQIFPSASVGSGGGFLVWQDNRIDTNGFGIGGLRLDGGLFSSGVPFRVNASPAGDQLNPQVQLLTNRGAIVVWQRQRQSANDIFARFLRPDGTFLTGDIQVSSATSNVTTIVVTNFLGWKSSKYQNVRLTLADRARRFRERSDYPVVAVLPDGNSVVAYSGHHRVLSKGQEIVTKISYYARRFYTNDVLQAVTTYDDHMQDVFFQRLSPAGQKLGKEIQVNQFASYNQRSPSIAVLSNGNFIITYVSELAVAKNQLQRNDIAILGRIFDGLGQSAGPEFRVSASSNIVANPAVSALADGRFTVVWNQRDSVRTNGWDIYGRLCGLDGVPTGVPFRLNTFTRGPQKLPHIAALGANQLVVWTSLEQDGWQEGVFARFLSGGAPVGEEIAVNSTTLSKQLHPTVVSDGGERFLALWASYLGSSAYDLEGQQYLTTQPEPSGLAAGANAHDSGSLGGGLSGSATGSPGVSAGSGTVAGALRIGLSFDEKGRRLYWNTEAGATYQVQASTNLTAWTNFGPARVAGAANESMTINVNGPAAFYRLIRVR